MKKDGIYHSVLQKMGDKLIHSVAGDGQVYQALLKELEDGQKVEIFLEICKDDRTLAQLAKVHKCIRTLATETGTSFTDMKIKIKKQAGLCIKKEFEGDTYLICKSFGDCSKDDLQLAIEACIEVGDFVGTNLR